MKFTEFREHGPSERWHAVVVRPIADLDVPTVATIYAEREGADLKLALERVSRWADPNQRRFVLVAEQRGRIQGYGKAEMLSPSEGGGNAPTGWYLTGLVVTPLARRHGVGARLTEERIRALAARTNDIWYVANLRNRATIALHERHGFVLQTREFSIPGVAFEGGQGALFRLCIRPS